MSRTEKQVVIVGCGFGGLTAAQEYRDSTIDTTLIDKTNHHLFQLLISGCNCHLFTFYSALETDLEY